MTFAPYDPSEAIARDRVRGRIGDTNHNERVGRRLEDETIAALLTRAGGNEKTAALAGIRELLALFAREADTGNKAAGLEATRRFERLKTIEESLERELGAVAAPSLLGLSQAYIEGSQADSDRIQPVFSVGMFDAQ